MLPKALVWDVEALDTGSQLKAPVAEETPIRQ